MVTCNAVQLHQGSQCHFTRLYSRGQCLLRPQLSACDTISGVTTRQTCFADLRQGNSDVSSGWVQWHHHGIWTNWVRQNLHNDRCCCLQSSGCWGRCHALRGNFQALMSSAGPENVELDDAEMQGIMPRAINQVAMQCITPRKSCCRYITLFNPYLCIGVP